MQIYWNKRKRLHKKGVQLPQDWFATQTWPPFHCFETPIWQPWHHVKTLYWQNLALSLINLLSFLHSHGYIYGRLKNTPPIAKMQKMWFITSFKEIDGTKNAVFSWFSTNKKGFPSTQFERCASAPNRKWRRSEERSHTILQHYRSRLLNECFEEFKRDFKVDISPKNL